MIITLWRNFQLFLSQDKMVIAPSPIFSHVFGFNVFFLVRVACNCRQFQRVLHLPKVRLLCALRRDQSPSGTLTGNLRVLSVGIRYETNTQSSSTHDDDLTLPRVLNPRRVGYGALLLIQQMSGLRPARLTAPSRSGTWRVGHCVCHSLVRVFVRLHSPGPLKPQHLFHYFIALTCISFYFQALAPDLLFHGLYVFRCCTSSRTLHPGYPICCWCNYLPNAQVTLVQFEALP